MLKNKFILFTMALGCLILYAYSISSHTNIRFATIEDNYQEKHSAKRLKTNKTEITSKIFQYEGPGWENENIAFRNYFDARNGIDIFGKKTNKMILDKVGIREDYHHMQDWGMDILKVGNSLGAGAIGLVIADTLYRIGPNSDGSYKMIREAKNDLEFELSFTNWKIQNRSYNISHRIKMKSGTHYYESKVHIDGLQGDEKLVAGIVSHIPKAEYLEVNNHKTLFTHGSQAVEGENLGMALQVSDGFFEEFSSANDYFGTVEDTHLIEMNVSSDIPTEWKFFAVWEYGDNRWKDKQPFIELLSNQ